MALTRFQSNLRFTLRKEPHEARKIPLNRTEQIGNVLAWFAYEFRAVSVKSICDPRFITVCFTSFAMILTALIFYPTTTWDMITRSCEWIFDHINWSYARFGLWALSEVTIFGVGMRAFGRFSNRQLMEHNGLNT